MSRAVGVMLLFLMCLHTWGCSGWERLFGSEWDNQRLRADTQLPVQATLPQEPPSALGVGPIVPRTAGLRVPRGYWARLRLNALDYWYPYSWGILEPSAGVVAAGQRSTSSGLTFRLLASHGPLKGVEDAVLRAVIQIAAPSGTKAENLVGLEFHEEALGHSAVSIRVDNGPSWLVEPTRLAFSELSPNLIKGVLEGRTETRQSSKKSRRVRVGFLALRAPEHGL